MVSLLSTRISSAPALVLGSYRDDELDRSEQLRVVLGELVRRPGRLSLAPLSPDTVAGLAEAEGRDPAELYRKTGGNPFFLTEVLATPGSEIPATVRDAVLVRAARLDRPARQLLDAVAVIPGAVELWLLESLAPIGSVTSRKVWPPGCLRRDRPTCRSATSSLAWPSRRRFFLLSGSRCTGRRWTPLPHAAPGPSTRRGSLTTPRPPADGAAVLRWAPAAAERAASSGAHRQAAAAVRPGAAVRRGATRRRAG